MKPTDFPQNMYRMVSVVGQHSIGAHLKENRRMLQRMQNNRTVAFHHTSHYLLFISPSS